MKERKVTMKIEREEKELEEGNVSGRERGKNRQQRLKISQIFLGNVERQRAARMVKLFPREQRMPDLLKSEFYR